MPHASLPPSNGLTDTWGRRNRKLADRACQKCCKTFRPLRDSSRYCSRPCMWANNGGHNRKTESWWVNGRGYVNGRVWVDGKRVNVKQHRVIAERMIGRPLRPDEDVHHIDGNKQNNDPSNLQVLSHSEHAKVSNSERTYNRGYRMNLTPEERKARSMRMKQARAALSRATGEA